MQYLLNNFVKLAHAETLPSMIATVGKILLLSHDEGHKCPYAQRCPKNVSKAMTSGNPDRDYARKLRENFCLKHLFPRRGAIR